MAKNIKSIAKKLRAQIVRKVPHAGGGAIGVARLAADVVEEGVWSLQIDAKKTATVAKSK